MATLLLTTGDSIWEPPPQGYCNICERAITDAVDWTVFIAENGGVGEIHPSCYDAVVKYRRERV